MVSPKLMLCALFAAAAHAQSNITLYRWNGYGCTGDEGELHEIPEDTCIYFPLSGDHNGPSPSVEISYQDKSQIGCKFTVTTANSCKGKKFTFKITKYTQCASFNTTVYPSGIIGTEWNCNNKNGGTDLEEGDHDGVLIHEI